MGRSFSCAYKRQLTIYRQKCYQLSENVLVLIHMQTILLQRYKIKSVDSKDLRN